MVRQECWSDPYGRFEPNAPKYPAPLEDAADFLMIRQAELAFDRISARPTHQASLPELQLNPGHVGVLRTIGVKDSGDRQVDLWASEICHSEFGGPLHRMARDYIDSISTPTLTPRQFRREECSCSS